MTRGKYIGLFCAIATSIAIGGLGYARPSHNWDMIAYIATAYNYAGVGGERLLQATLAETKAEVTPSEYQELTTSNDYRRTVSEDTTALEENINFYSVRPLYIVGLRILKDYLAIPYARGTYIISSIFAALSVLTLYFIFCPMNYVQLALFPAIIVTTGFVGLARSSTPDALATFLALLGLWGVARASKLTVLIAFILPYARPDYIILSVLMSIHTYLVVSRRWGVFSLITSFASYAIIMKFTNGYGWLTAFNFAFINVTPFPAKMVISRNLGDYVKPYYVCAKNFLDSAFFIPLAATCLLAIGHYSISTTRAQIFVISVAFFLLHLLVFPSYDPRFFLWCIGITSMFLFEQASLHAVPRTLS